MLRRPDWTVLVPVKATSRGKSRIDLPAPVRAQVALAMAVDTITAVARCADVLAIVEDDADAARLGAMERVVVHRTTARGLNESILDGRWLLQAARGADRLTRVAVLPGDLPGLRSEELAAALDRCTRHEFSVVADRQGVGTTLLTAARPAALHPHYGPDSFRRHQQAGAVPVDLPTGSSLRWDVDTVADLAAVSGPWTLAALAHQKVTS